jgi:hypothetical protein
MTERAQKIVDATMELTLRPQQGDRARVIAAAIREIIDEYEIFMDDDSYGNMVVTSNELRILADELEALK